MKLFLRVVFVIVGLVLIAVAIVLIAAATQSDKLAKARVESVLGQSLDTQVTVDSAEVAFLKQTLTVRGLAIGNPAGFKGDSAMHLDTVVVRFDGSTLFAETPVIDEVVVTGAKVNLQLVPGQGINLGALMEAGKRSATERSASLVPGARRTYLIRNLKCEGARVDFTTSLIPASGLGIDVAPFSLTEISKDHPVTAGQVTSIFIRSLLMETVSFKGLLRPVGEFLREELDRLMEDQPEPEQAPAP